MLPVAVLEAAGDDSCDGVIRDETDDALRRTDGDVGTPIITYGPPDGNSLFGPVISSVPDDDRALEFYDALRTLADVPEFSEPKRTDRAQPDLPIFAALQDGRPARDPARVTRCPPPRGCRSPRRPLSAPAHNTP